MTDITKDAVEELAERLRFPVHAMRPTISDGKNAAAMLRALFARVEKLEYIRGAKDEEIETLRSGFENAEDIRATAYKRGRLQGLDEAAKLSSEFTHANHVAQDMKDGISPEQSPVREAISRAIEALKETSQ